MTPLTISFPQPAPLLNLNDREHWAPKARKVREWRSATYWALRATNRAHPLRLTPTPCYVRVSFPVPDKRRRDPHNYVPTLKACVDGLAHDAELWPDDTPDWVTTIEPELRHDPDGDRIVTVTIWPREAAA